MRRIEVLIEGKPSPEGMTEALRIAGSVRTEEDGERTFVGWLALLALLESVVRDAP
jgi:hypothetical protein